MPEHVPARRIPEEQVAAILTRAAELDRAVRESFDLESIRDAATEAGISRVAVDRALEEYFAGDAELGVPVVEQPQAPARPGFLRRCGRRLRRVMPPVLYGLVALAIGSMLGGADEEALYLTAFLGWLVFAGVQVWRRRPSGRARGFLVTMAVMTFAGMVGMGGVNGDEEAMVATLFFGLGLMGYGTLYIKLRVGKLLQRMKRLADWVAPAT